MTRAARPPRALFWLVPIAFCVLLYWRGIRIFFEQDDFAWLNLRNHATGFRSLLWTLFAPLAQGTIRPLSERAFFMVFSYFFGVHALPFRLFVFLNQFVNIVLLILVTRKLTKSDVAAFVAPLLWMANTAVVIPMTWTSAYNEIQCTTFVLLAFYFFVRYTETNSRKFYWAQWGAFILGFGALEINVVYPAIAALYAFVFARRYVLSTLPMFAVSGMYAAAHRLFSAQTKSFYYDMDFHPATLLHTLGQYWSIILGITAHVDATYWPPGVRDAVFLLLTASLLAFAAWQAWRRQYLPLFLLGWFVIFLGPVLPLHNHVSDYYLFIGAIGIAMLAAYSISIAWQRGWLPATMAAVLALLYMIPSAIGSYGDTLGYFERADRGRAVIQSVAYAKRIHPGKTILLKDIDDETFWACIYDSPFRIFGWNDVFLVPECRAQIHGDPNLGAIDRYFLPKPAVAQALNDNAAVVYAFDGRQLRNMTKAYMLSIGSEHESMLVESIDVGMPYFRKQIGDGWYGVEGSFRWSTGHAVVYLPGPTEPKQKLTVHGWAPEQQIKLGPLHFALTIDGRPEPVKTIDNNNSDFHFVYDLPADLVGKPKIEVAFTIDRTFHAPNDSRELGLPFGEFSIQ